MAVLIRKQKCLLCKKTFSGNANKRFCSIEHKNAYHNTVRKKETAQIGKIITILKNNRRILEKALNKKEVVSVKEQSLLDEGFLFKYHTHNRVNQGDGKEYVFCFEYGYLRKDNGWCTIVKEKR